MTKDLLFDIRGWDSDNADSELSICAFPVGTVVDICSLEQRICYQHCSERHDGAAVRSVWAWMPLYNMSGFVFEDRTSARDETHCNFSETAFQNGATTNDLHNFNFFEPMFQAEVSERGATL